MINKVILRGRLCNDIVLRHTDSGTAICDYTIAVNKGYGDEQRTDFIDCDAWGKTAEFIAKYFSKGKMIEVEGKLKSSSWEDKRNGEKRYSLKVRTESVDFGESKNNSQSSGADRSQIGANKPQIGADEDDLPWR